jgi:hypothetical protein
MFIKVSKIIFSFLFVTMLVIPLLTTNLKKDTVSAAENRTLTQMAELYNEDGTLNKKFNSDFEAWINDNIGFRAQMVINNSKIQYYLFNVLANNSDMYLGPSGEFNYATADMLTDYQHLNLKSDEALNQLAEGFQYANNYLKEKGIQLYYLQCWDKHSIYPEYFPTSVIQYGNESKTDEIVQTLTEKTNVIVVSPKQELIKGKSEFETYSKWGDSTHWSQRGAFIGYQLLMNTINQYNGNSYKVLNEDGYNITLNDMGSTLFGGIHKECMLENFQIINPQAYLTNEKLTAHSDDLRHRFFTNNSVDNKTRVLVLGDSYIDSFIIDDIAESFFETLIIRGDYAPDFKETIDAYQPDIVIVENAERCDRTGILASTLLQIKANASE